MQSYFIKLLNYNSWANRKVMQCLKEQGVTNEKIMTLLSHIMSAQLIWLHRVKGLEKAPYELWKKYELTELEEMREKGAAGWLAFTKTSVDFNRVLKYHNYTGNYYENTVESIMVQLVNHASYHRGQIALKLREEGYEPVNTDYITYDRVVTEQLRD